MSSLRIVTPAPMSDALQLYEEIARLKPRDAKAAILQLARSETVAYYAGAELVAVAMYYPLPIETPGEDLRELAFACRPSFKFYLIPFMRHACATRAALASNGPVRVRSYVRQGHEPGRRLAVMCGLRLVGSRGAFDIWEFEGRPNDQICGRDQISVQR